MQFPPKKPILLVDFHNLAMVSFFSAQRTDPKFNNYTEETAKEVLHGILNTTLSVVGPKKLGPCLIAGAWDSDTNWRHDLDPQYKGGNTSLMKPETRLGGQMHKLKDQLAEYGILCERYNGLEADDTICLLAQHPELKGRHKVLLTRDRDALAYVNEETFFYNPKDKKLVTPKNFESYTAKVFELPQGLKPNEVAVFRAFAGDTSDQIPGVSNCGKIGALKVITTLREQGNPLTGPEQNDAEVKAIIEDLTPELPKNLQYLSSSPAINQLLHYYNLVRTASIPASLSRPVFAPLQSRFPEIPTPQQMINTHEKNAFHNFSKRAKEHNWGMGATEPEHPSQER